MMTHDTGMMDNPTMQKTYTKEQLLQMLEEVRSLKGWSRDKFAEEAGISKQRAKDWYRKDRTHEPNRWDADAIVNMYNKVKNENPNDPLVLARNQLDSAIKLWFSEEDIISARTLASAAYKGMLEIIIEKNIRVPLKIPKEDNGNVEAYIFFAIAMLQFLDRSLNKTELAFYSWLSYEDPKLFSEKSRIFINSIFPVNAKKTSRSEFFKVFRGEDVDFV